MRCPKCRSEVANQSVCPYCGSTVFVQGSTWSAEDFSRSTAPVGQIRDFDKPGTRELERKIRTLETRISLLLILQCGEFALIFLMLMLLAMG